MATLGITAMGVGGGGNSVYEAIHQFSASITTSGTTQQSAVLPAGEYARVKSVGGAVWVCFGQNPTAAVGTGFLLGDGDVLDVGPLNVGDRLAVIDNV